MLIRRSPLNEHRDSLDRIGRESIWQSNPGRSMSDTCMAISCQGDTVHVSDSRERSRNP